MNEGDNMPNLRGTLTKLQTALKMQGQTVYISTFQAFSKKTGRAVTKYVISERRGTRLVKVCETWRIDEAVRYLAGRLNNGGGNE